MFWSIPYQQELTLKLWACVETGKKWSNRHTARPARPKKILQNHVAPIRTPQSIQARPTMLSWLTILWAAKKSTFGTRFNAHWAWMAFTPAEQHLRPKQQTCILSKATKKIFLILVNNDKHRSKDLYIFFFIPGNLFIFHSAYVLLLLLLLFFPSLIPYLIHLKSWLNGSFIDEQSRSEIPWKIYLIYLIYFH